MYSLGKGILVTWTSQNIASDQSMTIGLRNTATGKDYWVADTLNDGNEIISVEKVSEALEAGMYKLFIKTAIFINGDSIHGWSNSFTLTSSTNPPTVPSVSVFSPKAGEILVQGTQIHIGWKMNQFPLTQKLRIDLMVVLGDAQNGNIGKQIALDVPNTGSYVWTVKSIEPFFDSESNRMVTPIGKYTIMVSCAYNEAGCNMTPNFIESGVFNIAFPVTPVPCYTFSTNLQLGSRGADVAALQTFLVAKGFKISDLSVGRGSEKGYFGRSTFEALKKYQESVGLPATGFFGPLTRAKVNADCSNPSPAEVTLTALQVGYEGQYPAFTISASSANKVPSYWDLKLDCPKGVDAMMKGGGCGATSRFMGSLLNLTSLTFNNPGRTEARVTVTASAYDTAGARIGQASMPIVVPVNTTLSKNSVKVTRPAAGEVLSTGMQYKIVWTTNSLDKDALFDITLFADNGKGLIAEGLTTAQASCTGVNFEKKGGPLYTCITGWTPTEGSVKAQLAVSKRGTSEVGYSGSFSIAFPVTPAINLVSIPNSSTIPNSFDYVITSAGSAFDRIVLRAECNDGEISIGSKGGMFCGENITINLTAPAGRYVFPVTFESKDGKSHTVGMTVTAYTGASIVGADKDAVTVTPSTNPPKPAIHTIISPNGGETYNTGDTVNIKWSPSGTSGDTVKIEVGYVHPDSTYPGGTYVEDWIIDKTANTGSYSWVIPEYYGTGIRTGSFSIKVTSVANGMDYSDNKFTIKQGVNRPNIVVSKPANGDVYKKGATVNIVWPSSGDSYGASLLRVEDPLFLRFMLNTGGLNGNLTWTVPTDIPDAKDYYIRINEGVYRNKTGYSGIFSVGSDVPPAQPTINVVTRLGGRVLSSSATNPCVSSLAGPTGNNTAGCVRTLTNQAPGTYSVVWYGGYPAGADTSKKPVITGAQTLGSSPITFYIDFSPKPIIEVYNGSSISASIWDAINEYWENNP